MHLQKISYKGAQQEWIQNLRNRDENKEAIIEKKSFEKAIDNRYNPLLFLRELDKVIFLLRLILIKISINF